MAWQKSGPVDQIEVINAPAGANGAPEASDSRYCANLYTKQTFAVIV